MTSINVAIKADLETFIKIREEHCGNVEHTTKRPKVRSGNQKILVIRPIRLRDLHFMTQFKGTTKEKDISVINLFMAYVIIMTSFQVLKMMF